MVYKRNGVDGPLKNRRWRPFQRWPPNQPPKIVEGIQKHRANHDTSIKFGRVIPKSVQKKLN